VFAREKTFLDPVLRPWKGSSIDSSALTRSMKCAGPNTPLPCSCSAAFPWLAVLDRAHPEVATVQSAEIRQRGARPGV
jgi:hypothetical protein